jgi:hypothetical protein
VITFNYNLNANTRGEISFMPQRIIKSSFIASPLVKEPSPIELIDALGKDSKKFVTMTSLSSYGLANLPPKEASRLFFEEKGVDFESVSDRLKDFWDSVKVLSESKEQITWLPTWEIHRPKIDGCTATLQKSSSTQTDYSLSVKVFGIGGGVSLSRNVGYKDTIEAEGECLQVRLPITITTQECISKKGVKFTRVNVKDIGTTPSAIELKGPLDHCGLLPSQLKASGWQTQDIGVPPKTTQKKDLSVQSSQAATLNLDLTIASVTIGPKAVLTLKKEIDYSYTLVGPHKYVAYFPKNAIAYYWSVV